MKISKTMASLLEEREQHLAHAQQRAAAWSDEQWTGWETRRRRLAADYPALSKWEGQYLAWAETDLFGGQPIENFSTAEFRERMESLKGNPRKGGSTNQ